MGSGSSVTLGLVSDRLLVGDDLGAVPPETPSVPLARDLERQQKRLRMKSKAAEETIVLDLRTASHRERSQLLHRLAILGVPWGVQADAGRSRGTFKEGWTLAWRPELSVALIDAARSGTTIETAATDVLARRAAEADVATLTRTIEAALLADLPDAVAAAVGALEERSARQHDTLRLMAAVEPLARLARYGDVRRVDTGIVEGVLDGIVLRVAIGLGAAVASLDDDAAVEVRQRVDEVQRGIAVLDRDDLRTAWLDALGGVAEQAGVHGSVAGRAVRILLDGGRIGSDEASRRLSRTLSRAADAAVGAAWLDGFLAGDASLLLHDVGLLAVLDEWVATVPAAAFDDVLPLVRRTFSGYSRAERRQVGERVRRLDGSGTPVVAAGTTSSDIDPARAALVHPVLRSILGGDS
jgi:hypothetical protein